MNRFPLAKFYAAAFFLLSLAAAHVLGQSRNPAAPSTVSVYGTIRDTSGRLVADANVSLSEKATATSLETKTKPDGSFSFIAPHSGTYTLRVEKSGLRALLLISLPLSSGEKRKVDLILEIDPLNQSPPGKEPGTTQAPVEFDDKPAFTVAGVTDWTSVGGHGSDTKLRTSESLARETAALKSRAPGEATAAGSASSSEADSHRLAGDRAEKSGDPLTAEHEYKEAFRLDPSEPNYFAWATELLLHRAVPEAVQVFTEAVEAHPKSPRLLAGLGAALYTSGSYPDAALRVCEASDLQPADPGPYIFLGKMEQAAPDPLPCVQEKLTRFAQQQPKNARANYYLAASLWKRAQRSENSADLQKCESLLRAAIRSEPKLDSAYILLGTVHASRADFRGAIDLYKQALKTNPRSSEAHYRLSQAYKRTGQEEKAEQEVQLYKQAEKAETDAVERQRREIRQFLIILWDRQKTPPQDYE